MLASAEQEFSFSTVGALALLVCWSVPPPQSLTESSTSRCSSAKVALGVLLDFTFGAHDWRLGTSFGSFVVEGGKIEAKAAVANCSRMSKWFADGQIPLIDFLLELGRVGHRTSRLAMATKVEARAVMLELFRWASDIIEVHGAECFSTGSATLPVLRLRSARARRFSCSRKLDLAKMTQQTKGVRKMEQLVASQEALAKRGAAPKTVSFKSVSRFVRDNLYQYYLSARQLWQSARHVGIVADCGRVSGHDLMVNMAYSSDRNIASWGPPQAISGVANPPFSDFEYVDFRTRHTSIFVHV